MDHGDSESTAGSSTRSASSSFCNTSRERPSAAAAGSGARPTARPSASTFHVVNFMGRRVPPQCPTPRRSRRGKASRPWRRAAGCCRSRSSRFPRDCPGDRVVHGPCLPLSPGSTPVVGLVTLAQAPGASSPSVSADGTIRSAFPRTQARLDRHHLVVSVPSRLILAVAAQRPDRLALIGLLVLAIAFASATHDIAYDAYTVDVLEKEEHGIAVGARQAVYRAAMLFSGGVAITMAKWFSWPTVFAFFALWYLPFLWVAWRAPEPDVRVGPPPTLRQAVWEPFLGFMRQHRALEILAFVVLYKLSDNLTQALTRPFLIQAGYGPVDVGVATATIGQTAAVVGGFVGGYLTGSMGLGRALWVFGFLQIVSNVGYADGGLDRSQPAVDVRGSGVRTRMLGPRIGCVRRPVAPAHAEAVLGDPVRASLEPLHDPEGSRGPAGRFDGRCDRLERLLPQHPCLRSSRAVHALSFRPLERARPHLHGRDTLNRRSHLFEPGSWPGPPSWVVQPLPSAS